MFSFDFCLDIFFSSAFQVVCGQIVWLGQPVSRLFSTSSGARSWNLLLSKKPNEGLGSDTVTITGEHCTQLTREPASGNSRVCKTQQGPTGLSSGGHGAVES